jgi:hypothetical protein
MSDTEYTAETEEMRLIFSEAGAGHYWDVIAEEQGETFDAWFKPYADALAAIQRVRELHAPTGEVVRCPDNKPGCCVIHYSNRRVCSNCYGVYPCTTIRALDGEVTP